MSTNFYLMRNATGEQAASQEHIGKRTAGTFLFQGQNHTTVSEWMARLAAMGNLESIVDEYGQTVRALEMAKIIFALGDYMNHIPQCDIDAGRRWIDGGYMFSNHDFC